jgi:hypothetical protein
MGMFGAGDDVGGKLACVCSVWPFCHSDELVLNVKFN